MQYLIVQFLKDRLTHPHYHQNFILSTFASSKLGRYYAFKYQYMLVVVFIWAPIQLSMYMCPSAQPPEQGHNPLSTNNMPPLCLLNSFITILSLASQTITQITCAHWSLGVALCFQWSLYFHLQLGPHSTSAGN